MTVPLLPGKDRYTHLRFNAAVQKRRTVERLKQAIATLEEADRPVTIFTIKEVSGLDYMAYYRNPEALALFRTHSTHLRKAQAKEVASHCSTKKKGKDTPKEVRIEAQGKSHNGKKLRRVTELRSAREEDDQLERRYQALLQEHMQCGLTIARLEAQVAQYLDMMEGFRSSLEQEEHDTSS